MKKLTRILMPVLVIGMGVLIYFWLVRFGPKPTQKPRIEVPPSVEVAVPQGQMGKLEVVAMGEVVPARQVVLQPQVSGRILWVSSRLVPGALVRKGELLARIEVVDYQLAVTRAEAAVVLAQRDLAIEEGRAQVAKEEWKLAQIQNASDSGRSLALREPQLKGAQAVLKSAQIALYQARLELSRTQIRSPFNAYVRTEAVEVGAQVSPQSLLATLVGSDEVWVQAMVPVDSLRWIDIPGLNTSQGSTGAIVQETGAKEPIRRTGRVIRLLRDLDPKGRMARLVISVPDPFAIKEKGALPLLTGAFVRVSLAGRQAEGFLSIPRKALRDGNRVWTVTEDCRLSLATVEVAKSREREVLVKKGILGTDRVVVSPLTAPEDGMTVRVLSSDGVGQEAPGCKPNGLELQES